MITTTKPDLDTEYILLGSMIMNKEILSACYNRYKLKQLKTRHFTEHYRPVVRWLFSYYADFNKAPKGTIQKIYDRRKRGLSEDAQDLIEQALDRLAEEYADKPETDTEYILKDVLVSFMREREIDNVAAKAIRKLDAGDTEAAEQIITSYAQVEKEEALDVIIPYSKEDVVQHWSSDTEAINEVYRFEGDLGKLVGPLERGWLLAVMGIEKVGKSFLLNEMAFQAALHQKRKVLIINLELTENTARNRLRRRISLTANTTQKGRIVYPVLDCENNQYGTCEVWKRPKKGLFRTTNDMVSWRRMRTWKTCTRCRGKTRRNAARTKRFIPAVWFEQERVEELSKIRLRRTLKTYRLYGMQNLRVKCFPRFSKTFDETRDFILRYTEAEDWHPDIVIYDYLDILAAEPNVREERIIIDRQWKKAAQLAGELNCLVVTADQANKAGRTQRSLDQMSTSESKTKDSHLDVRLSINQTEAEKEISIARLAVLFHRHAPFNINNQVVVTQRLATAEAAIDSAYWYTAHDKYRVQVETL